jgi:hypothetical protein
MPVTTNYLLRYPLATGTVDIPGDLGNLANDTDGALRNLANNPCAIATRTSPATQSIPSGAFTDVTFPVEDFDNAGLFTPGAAVITVALFGVYTVSASVQWQPNATGSRALIVLLNGVEIPSVGNEVPVNSVGNGTRLSTAFDIALSPSNQLKVQVLQGSGGNLNVLNARFSVRRVIG